jgi:TrmH family RNA methyltransferase
MHKITSAANPTIKLLKSLHAKKGRQRTGLFLAEGARLAQEAADLGVWPELLIVAEAALDRPYAVRLVEGAERERVRVAAVSERVLEQIARRANPQSVIGAYRQRWADLDAFRGADLIVALNEVRDPGNLGTIMRTCDAVGAAGVVLTGACCDPFSVETVRATMGSIFTVAVAAASFQELDEWRRSARLKMIGAAPDATARHDSVDVSAPLVVLMGNEQSGLPPEARSACDALVRIPMRGRADSLNLAMATTVMLYDVWRRRSYAGAR